MSRSASLPRPAGQHGGVGRNDGAGNQPEPEAAGSQPATIVDPPPRPARRSVDRSRGLIGLLALLLVLMLGAAAVTTGLVRRSLTHSLDRQVHSASDRYAALMDDPSDNDHDADDDFDRMVGPAAGTLGAVVAGGRLQAVAVIGRGSAVPGGLAGQLGSLRPAADVRTSRLVGLGSYRVLVHGTASRYEVVGLPLQPVDRTVNRLLAGEAALIVLVLGLLAGLSVHLLRRDAGRAGRTPADEAGLQVLLAEASHELRTPAAVIHSYAELAGHSPTLPASVDRALQRIESESARMGRMVEDLLTLSRFEGGYRPPMTEVDLTKLLLDAVDDARVTGRQNHWELAVPDQPVEVLGNAPSLFQAIAAVLANALAHTPPGSTVRVTLRRSGGLAEVVIADNGPGIPPDILPAVFERFVRSGDESRYDGRIGVGLGLSVVRQNPAGARRHGDGAQQRGGRRVRAPAAAGGTLSRPDFRAAVRPVPAGR